MKNTTAPKVYQATQAQRAKWVVMDNEGDEEGERWWKVHAGYLADAEAYAKLWGQLTRAHPHCEATRNMLKLAKEGERDIRCAMLHRPVRSYCEHCRPVGL